MDPYYELVAKCIKARFLSVRLSRDDHCASSRSIDPRIRLFGVNRSAMLSLARSRFLRYRSNHQCLGSPEHSMLIAVNLSLSASSCLEI
jgi:hypothetical protein